MKFTYDKSVDACYIYLAEIVPGDIKETNSFSVENLVQFGSINLDFDKGGKILGIEILDASDYLPKEFLEKAEQLV